MSMTPEERAEFLQIYLDETEEELESLVQTLLLLEDDPENKASLNEAFRMVHSIKGAAGMMGFDEVTALAHQLESRFEKLRSGQAILDEATTTVSLKCVDYLRQCNEEIREGKSVSNAAVLLGELAALDSASAASPAPAVREALSKKSAKKESPEEKSQKEPTAAPPTTLTPSTDVKTQTPSVEPIPAKTVSTPATLKLPTYQVTVTFEPELKLLDMKGQLVLTRLAETGDVLGTEPSIEALATLTGPVRFDLLVATDHSEEQILEAADVHGVMKVTASPSDEIVMGSPPPEATPTPVPNSVQNPPPKNATEKDATEPAVPKSKVAETVRVEIDRLDNLLNLAGELVVNKARFSQIAVRMSPAFQQSGGGNRHRAMSESMRWAMEEMRQISEQSGRSDWALQLAELEIQLEEFEQQTDHWEESRRCFSQINEAIDQLARVSDSLQRGVLQTRMVPVAPLFNRFKRVVRDFSSNSGKKISLQIRGEKTELDKRMIDELGDPLVHLIRNSIDHGMETPEERVRLGKPETGVVLLEASHSGNNIFIRVRDDGRGISVDKVRTRIVERELMSASAAKELSNEQVIEYIWHPGFSTASQVTNISGRGVGMDIVKTRIADLNGTVEIESTPGEGTTFTIRLPLTLAIINGLLFRIGEVTYAVPIDEVREIVSVPVKQVVAVHGKETLDVRGEYIPVVSITDLFSWNSVTVCSRSGGGEPSDESLVNVLVLQVAGRSIGLKVDELLGGEDIVIKSLSENFVNIRGLSGASILGNGTVSLLLDVGTMMNMLTAL